MGTDPNSPDNRWLRDAMERQIPVIYFLGTSPGRYQPIIPTFIVGWYPERLRVRLAFGAIVGASAQAVPPDAPERRYAQGAAASGIVPGRRTRGLWGTMCNLATAGTPAARCRPHRRGCRRAAWAADRLEWPTVDEAPSRGHQCPFRAPATSGAHDPASEIGSFAGRTVGGAIVIGLPLQVIGSALTVGGEGSSCSSRERQVGGIRSVCRKIRAGVARDRHRETRKVFSR
jgi:hypothetical protein